MDGQTQSISPSDLYARLGTAPAPALVDVRRQDAFGGDDRLIIGVFHRPPKPTTGRQKRALPHDHKTLVGRDSMARRP